MTAIILYVLAGALILARLRVQKALPICPVRVPTALQAWSNATYKGYLTLAGATFFIEACCAMGVGCVHCMHSRSGQCAGRYGLLHSAQVGSHPWSCSGYDGNESATAALSVRACAAHRHAAQLPHLHPRHAVPARHGCGDVMCRSPTAGLLSVAYELAMYLHRRFMPRAAGKYASDRCIHCC